MFLQSKYYDAQYLDWRNMIEWIKYKKIQTKAKNCNGFITRKMALRVCDVCGKKEEVNWHNLNKSRETRNEEVDRCNKCALKSKKPYVSGKNHALWQHGKDSRGYVRFSKNGKVIKEHIYVMQEHIGRNINKGEAIHHIDLNKSNNDLENLYLFETSSKHAICHRSMEEVGYSIFGKLIWFNWESKQYSLEMTLNPIKEHIGIKLPDKLYERRHKNSKNYYQFFRHNGEKSVHVFVIEKTINRPLFKNECVHHVDGNSLNNNLNNLCLLTCKEHGKAHFSLQLTVAQLYKQGIIKFIDGSYFLKE